MPTREVLNKFSDAHPDATGVGPIHGHDDHVPQSLVDRHNNLAAKPNKTTSHSPHRGKGSSTPEEHDRVRSTGARTPGALAAEIRDQIKQRVDGRDAKNPSK